MVDSSYFLPLSSFVVAPSSATCCGICMLFATLLFLSLKFSLRFRNLPKLNLLIYPKCLFNCPVLFLYLSLSYTFSRQPVSAANITAALTIIAVLYHLMHIISTVLIIHMTTNCHGFAWKLYLLLKHSTQLRLIWPSLK